MLNDKQSKLIHICSVCKGRAYPGSAGPWLGNILICRMKCFAKKIYIGDKCRASQNRGYFSLQLKQGKFWEEIDRNEGKCVGSCNWYIAKMSVVTHTPASQLGCFLCPQLQRSWRGILLLGCSSARPSVRPSVLPSVHPSVRSSRFLMHRITLKPWMLLFWNFIYGFLMKK